MRKHQDEPNDLIDPYTVHVMSENERIARKVIFYAWTLGAAPETPWHIWSEYRRHNRMFLRCSYNLSSLSFEI